MSALSLELLSMESEVKVSYSTKQGKQNINNNTQENLFLLLFCLKYIFWLCNDKCIVLDVMWPHNSLGFDIIR